MVLKSGVPCGGSKKNIALDRQILKSLSKACAAILLFWVLPPGVGRQLEHFWILFFIPYFISISPQNVSQSMLSVYLHVWKLCIMSFFFLNNCIAYQFFKRTWVTWLLYWHPAIGFHIFRKSFNVWSIAVRVMHQYLSYLPFQKLEWKRNTFHMYCLVNLHWLLLVCVLSGLWRALYVW